jgi:hypothetical protein
MKPHLKIVNLLRRQKAAGNLAEISLLLLLGFMVAMSIWIYPLMFANQPQDQDTIPVTGGFDISLKQSLGNFGGVTGESRWVSSELLDTVYHGLPFVLQTRALRANLINQPDIVQADWVSANPRIALVSKIDNRLNSITLLAQGSTYITVQSGGVLKTLYISAAYLSPSCDQLRVIISQTAQPALKVQTCQALLPLIINGN